MSKGPRINTDLPLFWWYEFVAIASRAIVFHPLGGIRTIGEENIPSEGPVILAPNHVSNLDPMIMPCSIRRHMRFMAKEELFTGPVGWLIASVGGFPIRRGESDREAIKAALTLLKRGEMILIFPEGQRSDGMTMLPLNKGVGFLARMSNALVIPVGIVGTEKCLPKGSSKIRRGMGTVICGKGFRYTDAPKDGFEAMLESRILELTSAYGLPLKPFSGAAESSIATQFAEPNSPPATEAAPG